MVISKDAWYDSSGNRINAAARLREIMSKSTCASRHRPMKMVEIPDKDGWYNEEPIFQCPICKVPMKITA